MNLLKSPGTKISAIFIGAGSILSLSIFILILIKLGNTGILKQEINQLSKTMENIQTLTGDEEKFNKECEKIQNKSGLVLKKSPKEAQIPQTIDQLTSAIEYLNLKLISIVPKEAIEIRKQKESLPMGLEIEGEPPLEIPEEAETKPDYVQIPIEIYLRGSYPDIGHYLDSLRYLPRLVTVEGINIEKAQEAGMLDIKLLVSVYYSEN